MQYVKQRKDLVFIANPLFFIAGIFIFWYALEYIAPIFKIFWLALAIALVVIASPWGNTRLSHSTDDIIVRMPFLQWFGRIIVLELGLIGVYAGMCFISGSFYPVMVTEMHPHLFSRMFQDMIHNGLFPWSLYALGAACMSILAYRKQTHAFLSNLLKPLTKQDLQGTLSLICNVGARRSTIFAFALPVMFFTLLLSSFVVSQKLPLITGFQLPTMLTTLGLLLLSSTKPIQRYIDRLFARKISTVWGFLMFGLLLAIATLLINTIAIGVAIKSNTNVQTPGLFIDLSKKSWMASWITLSNVWWLCLTPSVCAYFATISKGYRVRDVLLGILLLPALIGIFIWVMQYVPTIHIPTPSILTQQILCTIAFLVALPMLLNHHNASNSILAYFPKAGIIKQRDQKTFFRNIAKIAIALLYIFLVLGANAINILFFSANYFSIVFSIAMLAAALIHLIRKS